MKRSEFCTRRPGSLSPAARRARLDDYATTEQPLVRVIQDARLPRRNRPNRLSELERDAAVGCRSNRAGHRARPIAALHPHRITGTEWLGEPGDPPQGQGGAEQL